MDCVLGARLRLQRLKPPSPHTVKFTILRKPPMVRESPTKILLIHRVRQGAAQRGAQRYFIFAVLCALLLCSKTNLSYLKSCTPVKATP